MSDSREEWVRAENIWELVVFWLFTTDGYRSQAEAARTADRLIRNDAASVSCMTDQIRTRRASR